MSTTSGIGGRGPLILAVSWAETVVGIAFFTLRLMTSWRFIGRFRWDFWLSAIAMVREYVLLQNEWEG